MERTKKQKIFAWVAVSISALFTNLWAFWGIVENFHEGWYFKSVWRNIVLMFGQYLLIPILFMILAYISVRWHRIGAILHIILILGLVFLFGGTTVAILFIYLPLVGLAALYWYGKLDKKKLAYYLVVVLPLFIIFVFGAANGFRVAERVNDNNFGSRQIKGNGVELIWATEGPGWPNSGITWFEAKNICARLSEDGKTISDSVLNIWRLPTVNEVVRSMVYHGKNAGGIWDAKKKAASYQNQPDKESPLWNVYSKVIYWWTADTLNDKQAMMVVYNGGVWPRDKKLKMDDMAFRAVRDVKNFDNIIKEHQ